MNHKLNYKYRYAHVHVHVLINPQNKNRFFFNSNKAMTICITHDCRLTTFRRPLVHVHVRVTNTNLGTCLKAIAIEAFLEIKYNLGCVC